MRMREIINIIEDAGDSPVPGLRARFADFDLADLRDMAGRFDTADAFADRVLDPSSPDAEEGRAQLAKLWTGKTPDDHFTSAISPLEQFVAERIGAFGWKGVTTMGLPWGNEGMMGGSGTIFNTPDGQVYLDAGVEKGTIYLPQIAVERKGSGLGGKIMDAIHDYAIEHTLHVYVYKVTNQKFFDRFDWLKQKDHNTFVSTF